MLLKMKAIKLRLIHGAFLMQRKQSISIKLKQFTTTYKLLLELPLNYRWNNRDCNALRVSQYLRRV